MRPAPHRLACLAMLAFLAALPIRASACTACYGQADSRMTESMRWGIVVMMVVTGGVFTGIGAVAYSIWKRGRDLEVAEANVDVPPGEPMTPSSATHRI